MSGTRAPLPVRVAAVLLVVYVALVLTVTMWPTPVDQGHAESIRRLLSFLHRHGVPQWFGYRKLEFGANIAMFVPLGLLLGLVLPRRLGWVPFVVVPSLSIAIEVTQALLLAARFATPQDVLANTIGGYLGATVAVVVHRVVGARRVPAPPTC